MFLQIAVSIYRYFRIVKGQLASPKGTATADILVNAVDSQQAAVFPVGNKSGVDRFCPVIELLAKGEPEPQGIRAGQ